MHPHAPRQDLEGISPATLAAQDDLIRALERQVAGIADAEVEWYRRLHAAEERAWRSEQQMR